MNYSKAIILLCLVIAFACTSSRLEKGQIQTSSGLVYEVIEEGQGIGAKEGDEVMIEERTSYLSGRLIFSTDQIGGPLKVKIGAKGAE